jgi:hypothetical protein
MPGFLDWAKEQLLVAAGQKALTDQKVREIKDALTDDMHRGGATEAEIAEAMAEVDRHVAQLKEQIPVPDVIEKTKDSLFNLLRWASVGIGVVVGLYVLSTAKGLR